MSRKRLNKPIVVIGSSGRMGQELYQLLEDKKLPFFGVSEDGLAKNYLENYKFKSAPFKEGGVLIDFSSAKIFDQVLTVATQNKIPLVSGTTGLTGLQLQKISKAAKEIPILWSSNMSLGIAVMNDALRSFSALKNFDFQIEEFHHRKKIDAPSGTALSLQKNLAQIVQVKLPKILSVRAGGIFGIHKIHAVSEEEHLIFEHSAINRKVFARGALLAATWIVNKPKGLYSLTDLLHDL